MTRTALVALVIGGVLLAAVLVVLPLLRDEAPSGGAEPQELAAARAAAQLAPCPSPDRGAVPQLKGVRATCLADGARVDVGRALGGRVTLVNLWATWCQPCREELPVLADYAKGPDAVDVLLVQIDSPMVDGLEMLAELGVRLPSVHDGDDRGPIRTALRTGNTLPASYLVDEDGKVSFIENPRVLTSVEQVRSAVTRHRKGAA